ncbi:MAG: hypothetical protein RL259_1184, partial [Bacteroidota bacterium]
INPFYKFTKKYTKTHEKFIKDTISTSFL